MSIPPPIPAGIRRTISPQRKALYYTGMAISLVGAILCISMFYTAISEMTRSHPEPQLSVQSFQQLERDMNQQGTRIGWAFARFFTGMVLAVVGTVIMQIGKSGAAGAGIMLDPEQQREDLEPWNRATGGMVADTLSETAPVIRDIIHSPTETGTIIKVRCRNCHAINDEDAKFCKSCGKPI